MSDLLIDPIAFSRQQQEVFGQTPITGLARVKTAVVNDDAVVTWHVAGAVDSLNRAVLSLRIGGEVHVECQRCLEPMPVPLAIATDITLFRTEEQLAAAEADDPELECLLLEEATDLMVLIEDEILLALPFAPLHDECVGPVGDVAAGAAEDDDEELPAASPFAALAALKRNT